MLHPLYEGKTFSCCVLEAWASCAACFMQRSELAMWPACVHSMFVALILWPLISLPCMSGSHLVSCCDVHIGAARLLQMPICAWQATNYEAACLRLVLHSALQLVARLRKLDFLFHCYMLFIQRTSKY